MTRPATNHPATTRPATAFAALLLAGTALLPVAARAAPNRILFSTGALPSGARLAPGASPSGPVTVLGGITQVQTAQGEVFSFVGDAAFDAAAPDLAITDGTVTVSSGADGAVAFTVGGTIRATVSGSNALASFTVKAGSIAAGRVLGGTVSVATGGVTRSFDIGQAFAAQAGAGARPVQTAGVVPIAAAPPVQAGADLGTTGIDSFQNPTLLTLPGGNDLALLRTILARRDDPSALSLPGVSAPFLDAVLASLRYGERLGSLTQANVVARTLDLIAAAQKDSARPADAPYLDALLALFLADGYAADVSPDIAARIENYRLASASGLPTGTMAVAELLSTYVGDLLAGRAVSVPYTPPQLRLLADYLRAAGLPDGLSDTARARIETLFAYADLGGTFGRTPGPLLPVGGPGMRAGATSSLMAGDYTGSVQRFRDGRARHDAFLGASTFDTAGGPITLGDTFNRGTDIGVESASGADWTIGRTGENARATYGAAFAVARPYAGQMPLAGTATYDLLAATTPHYADGRAVTAAEVAATVTARFLTAGPQLSVSGQISATDTGVARTYGFTDALTGGAAAVTATNGDACGAAGCTISPILTLGGADGQVIVGTYQIAGTGDAPILGGAWAFGGTLPQEVGGLPLPSDLTRVDPVGGIASRFRTGVFAGAQMTLDNTSSWRPLSLDFNDAGQSRTAPGLYQVPASAIAGQSAGTDEWLLSRWLTSAMRHERDIVVLRPLGPGLAIPTTGRAEFSAVGHLDILSATASTYTATRLDGRIAIAFGTTPRFGIDAVLGLTQGNGAVDIYRLGTPGMFDTPIGAMLYDPAQGELRANSAAFAVTGPDCGTGCRGALSFAYGGTTGNLFGGTFQVTDGAAVNQLFGSAMFQQVATGSTTSPEGIAGRVGGPVTPPPVETGDAPQVLAGANESLRVVSAITASNGALTAFTVPPSGLFGGVSRSVGTAQNNDFGAVGTTIGWTRWAGGTPTTTPGGGTVQNDPAIPFQGGRHYIWGTRAFDLPAGGRATYRQVGSTAISTDQGAPLGSINAATLAVEFGTSPLVGFDVTMTAALFSYQMSSAGGSAAPSIPIDTATMGFETVVPVTQSAVGCAATACNAQVRGFLAGHGASHAGLTFRFATNPNRGAPIAEGVIAFAK